MKISAALLVALDTPLSLQALELDEPRPDEVLIRIVATGICHTDIALIQGHPVPLPVPFVLGHEGAGVVERMGAAVKGLAPGDHVVLSFDHCGACPRCQSGDAAYCEHFFVNFSGRRRDGSTTLAQNGKPVFGNFFGQSSFSTHVLASARNSIKVPKDLLLETLGPLGCGIQTGAGAVINALRPRVGDSIAVFGAGAVGLSAVMAAKVMGATTIIAIDLHEDRLQLARELGATHVVNAAGDVRKAVAAIAPKGVDYSLDASAAAPAIATAMAILAVRGVCGIVGGGPPVTLDTPALMQGGRAIRGIGLGDAVPALFIPKLLDLHRQGRFPFERLIRTYPLERINEAIADSKSGRTIKPVVVM